MNISKPLLKTAVLGFMSGMRSFSGITAASIMLAGHPSKKLKQSGLRYVQLPAVRNTLVTLALGEFVGDKLPAAPNRTEAAGLSGRVAFGTLTGLVIAKANNQNLLKSALIAGSCALAATFVSFYLRKAAADAKLLPDFSLGAIEDILVLTTAVVVIS